MKYILKDISHFDFFNKLEQVEKEIRSILEKKNYEAIKLKSFAEKNIAKIKAFISENINNSGEILRMLNYQYPDIFDNFYSSYSYDLRGEEEKEVLRLDRFRVSLKMMTSYLSQIETFQNQNSEIILRDINEKTDFILNKLNNLFSDDFYSIGLILKLNNLKYRDGETREIGEDLKRRGYLHLKENYGESDLSKITVKGAAYIERKNKRKNNSHKKTELDNKIDNIIQHIEKLGFGQEIIFNEIEELRELQHKLSKKSWSQLLKGKLMDLALDELINTETASSIFEYLTNIDFRLLE